MKKVVFTKFAEDKVQHFFGGFSVALVALFIILLGIALGKSVKPHVGYLSITIATLIVAVGKEIYDLLKKKTFIDIADILFTMIGSIPVLVLWLFINII